MALSGNEDIYNLSVNPRVASVCTLVHTPARIAKREKYPYGAMFGMTNINRLARMLTNLKWKS